MVVALFLVEDYVLCIFKCNPIKILRERGGGKGTEMRMKMGLSKGCSTFFDKNLKLNQQCTKVEKIFNKYYVTKMF